MTKKKKLTNTMIYELVAKRFQELKEHYERLVAQRNPDAFLVRNTMDLNERLMKIFKVSLS